MRTLSSSNRILKLMSEMNQAIWPEHFARNLWITPAEKRMIKASTDIRSRNTWKEEIKCGGSRDVWKKKLRAEYGLSDKETNYIVDELEYYASIDGITSTLGIKSLLIDMVWQCAAGEYGKRLKAYMSNVLEQDSELMRDWAATSDMPYVFSAFNEKTGKQMDSGCKVVRLVDPAMYPLVYGSSHILDDACSFPEEILVSPRLGRRSEPHGNAAFCDLDNLCAPISSDILAQHDKIECMWLPSDIYIDECGTVEFKSYINNLHPVRHKAAYKIITSVLEAAIPALEQVFTDLVCRRKHRIKVDVGKCIVEKAKLPSYFFEELFDLLSDTLMETVDRWQRGVVLTAPEPMDFIVPDRPLSGHSLRNMYLQVYVKMTNIYLEPDRQQCASEVWHTSGSNSERIVATAICAYDIDNIKDVAVELREYVELDEGVDLRDHFTHLIYEAGVSEESPEYQNYLGKVRLDEGSIVCYPNTYQRRMLPLRLAEPTRSGHVKIVYFYFVDPSRPVASTSRVPPQQPEWRLSRLVVADSPLKRLPEDIQIRIAYWLDTTRSFEQEAKRRDSLDMAYRKLESVNRSCLKAYALRLNASSRYFNSY